mgnify:CR=1 FL=1
MTHVFHPDSHSHGLADGCPRCAEHAEDLISLDDDNLTVLYRRTLAFERDDDIAAVPRSDTEGRAMRKLNRIRLILYVLRAAGVEP